MRQKISAILNDASSRSRKERRIEILRTNDHPALRIFLACALHPKIEWDLPDEDPAYTPNELKHDQEGIFYREIRKLYLYLKPNHIFKEYNGRINQAKRQLLFIQLLEAVDSEDAIYLMAARKKKLPVKLSKETIEDAFPGLLTWGET